MLDGRIDTQGTIKELRARGVLDDITHDESIEAHKEEQAVEAEEAAASGSTDNVDDVAVSPADENSKPAATNKKPRKFIEEEKRETGRVKWRIYNTYLKASCAPIVRARSLILNDTSPQVVLDMGNSGDFDPAYTGTLHTPVLEYTTERILASWSSRKSLDQGAWSQSCCLSHRC